MDGATGQSTDQGIQKREKCSKKNAGDNRNRFAAAGTIEKSETRNESYQRIQTEANDLDCVLGWGQRHNKKGWREGDEHPDNSWNSGFARLRLVYLRRFIIHKLFVKPE
ncbi:MAG TPA: hypothetical protein VH619_14940 [Verrucomicrobiae bacterium]|nr:hypothetical protein [Verrucomicrobiae bacterium]